MGIGSVFYLPLSGFQEILQQHKDQVEIYTNIKDQVRFNNQLDTIQVSCFSCSQINHTVTDCPYLFYGKKKEYILRKAQQEVTKKIKNFKRQEDRGKFQTILRSVNVKQLAEQYMQENSDEFSSRSEDEDEEEEEEEENDEEQQSLKQKSKQINQSQAISQEKKQLPKQSSIKKQLSQSKSITQSSSLKERSDDSSIQINKANIDDSIKKLLIETQKSIKSLLKIEEEVSQIDNQEEKIDKKSLFQTQKSYLKKSIEKPEKVEKNEEIVHRTLPTVGIDFICKTIQLDNKTLRLQLWDTAGQERFKSLIPSYIRDSNAAIIVYDITNQSSFNNLNKWIEEVKEERGNDALIFVLGNKADLDERKVTVEEANQSLKQFGLQVQEVSAKSGLNIATFFKQLAQALNGGPANENDNKNQQQQQNSNQQQQQQQQSQGTQLKNPNQSQQDKESKKSGCC